MDSGPRQPPGGGQPEGGEHLASDAPRNGVTHATRTAGGAPNAHTHTGRPACGASVWSSPIHAPPRPQQVHQPRKIRAPPPALRHSDTTLAEHAAPLKTRLRSLTLDAAQEVTRALGLRGGEGDPPQEDAGADSDLEIFLEPPAGSTPAEPAPPAGSVPALCPAWKRGHCTGENWCPKRHPQPGPDDGALPAVGHAAARAALRSGLRRARFWMRPRAAA